jgi:tetratricopeptide (TPR) repeat protein
LEGQFSSAIKSFENGKKFIKDKRYDLAINEFSLVIEKFPEYISAFENRGYSYLMSDDIGDAINDFNKVIKLDPNNFFAYGYRGEAYYRRRNYIQAIEDLETAVKLNPVPDWEIDVLERAKMFASGKKPAGKKYLLNRVKTLL